MGRYEKNSVPVDCFESRYTSDDPFVINCIYIQLLPVAPAAPAASAAGGAIGMLPQDTPVWFQKTDGCFQKGMVGSVTEDRVDVMFNSGSDSEPLWNNISVKPYLVWITDPQLDEMNDVRVFDSYRPV